MTIAFKLNNYEIRVIFLITTCLLYQQHNWVAKKKLHNVFFSVFLELALAIYNTINTRYFTGSSDLKDLNLFKMHLQQRVKVFDQMIVK